MYKAVLFDGDGVVIKAHKFFSQRLSDDFNIPTEEILPFVKNDLNLCFENKADLKNILPGYLSKWGVTKNTDEILKYWFEGESEVNQQVLDIVNKLRSNGIICCVTSDNEKYRGEYIKNTMKLNEAFDNFFFSYSVGLKKANKQFWENVVNKISLPASEILHWDDDSKYNVVASEVGIDSRLFKSTEDFFNQMKEIYTYL